MGAQMGTDDATMPAAVARLRFRTGPPIGIRNDRSGCFSRIRSGMPAVSLPKTRQEFGSKWASQKEVVALDEK